MKIARSINKRWALLSVLMIVAVITSLLSMAYVSAEEGFIFSVSPMKEKIVLNPGDEYSGSLEVIVPDKYDNDMEYSVEVAPFFVDENYNHDFSNEYGTNNEIVKWISFNTPKSGRLSPGQKTTIIYTINVPEDAAGGGQYAAILVTADIWHDNKPGNDKESGDEIGAALKEEKKIAYTIYAEIAGDVTRQGKIVDIDVSGFLLSGNISGVSSIENAGNVHGEAKYALQVFPLFSNEELYTNEETPSTRTILPGRILYNQTEWANTPAIGIFNVVYTVEFEGVTAQVSKMVIKCPIWLLFIVIFAIAAIIIYFVVKAKARKSPRKVGTE